MPPANSQAQACVIDQLNSWFQTTQHSPSFHDINLLFSRLVEEHTDFLVALQEAGLTTHGRDEIGFSVSVLDFLKRRFSAVSQGIEIDIPSLDRASVLRALCHQIVTAVAIANALEMNITGAMGELVASNQSKLGEGNKPVFNLQRKLVPASGFTAPQYSAYI